ncbi:MAG: beta strand repeat-containing protein [Kiritimatiellia bacterium]
MAAVVAFALTMDAQTPLQAADAISLNFGSDKGEVAGEYGIFPATGWVNLSAVGNTRTDLTSMNGAALGKLVWSSNNKYQWEAATENALKGYLDDGGSGISIALTGIPFAFYRVIVYQATDEADRQFNPPSINGVYYSSDGTKKCFARNNSALKYGASRNLTAVVGTNVIEYPRVFSGDLTILGGSNANSARGCIAALQIVEADVYTATLTADDDFDNLTWSPEKPEGGFPTGSVLKVVYTGESPVTLTANGDYSGVGLAISGPIALKTTTGFKTSCATFAEGATLDLSAMAIEETAQAAVRGVPAATDFILGEFDLASTTVTLPTVASGYTVAFDTVNGYGTRLVVSAPNSADFGSASFNVSRTFDNAELADGTKYGLFTTDKSAWTIVATNGAGKVTTTTAGGLTLTPTIDNLALDPSDMGDGLFDSAVNDNPNNDESTATYGFTLSGINTSVGEKYRVIVYLISNQGSGFSPVTIGGKTYHGPSGAGVTLSSDDEVRWGTLSANSTAAEGLNTVISGVLTDDSVTIETCRNYNQYGARASVCALQVVKVGQLAEIVDFTANLTGDALWSTKSGIAEASAVWANGAGNRIVLTNTANAGVTLTFDESIVAQTLKIVSPAGYRVRLARTDAAVLDIDNYDYSEATNYVVCTWPVSTLVSDTIVNRAWGGGNADSESAIAINHAGGALNLVEGTWKLAQSNNGTATTVRMVDAEIAYTDVLGIGTASYYLGGTTAVTTPSLVISQGAAGRTAALELADSASVMVTGSTSVDQNTSSVMFGHWNGPGTFTIKDNASFTAPGDVLVGKTGNTQTINIAGGVFTAQGIKLSVNAIGANTLNLSGGVLALGATGIDTYSASVTMAVNVSGQPELRATGATLPVVEPVDIASGATLKLTKAANVDAATVAFSAAVTGEGAIDVGDGVTLKLIGAARPQGVITLAEGAKLQVQQLNSAEGTITLKLAAAPAEGALTVFDYNGNVITPVTTFADGTLTMKAINLLTVASENTTSFNEAENWSLNTVPNGGAIVIAVAGECTVSLSENVTVDLLTVRGEGSLTFTGEGLLTADRLEVMEGSRVNYPIGGNLSVSGACTLASGAILALSAETDSQVAFAISGAGAVETAGNITFTTANTFTGGLTVKSGIVKTARNSGLGGTGEIAYNAQVTVEDGAAVDLANTTDYCYAFTIAGQGVEREDGTFSGAIFNSGAVIGTGQRQMYKLVLSGDASVRADAGHEWGIIKGSYEATELALNGHTLVKTGAGEVYWTQTNMSADDAGVIKVAEGALRFAMEKNNNLAGARIEVKPGAALRVYDGQLSACAGLFLQGGNTPIEFKSAGTATGNVGLGESVVPVVNSAYFDVSQASVGTEITFVTDPNSGLLGGTDGAAIVSTELGSRFGDATVEAGAVKATVQDPLAANKFMHYEFNESGDDVTLDGAKAADSTCAFSTWSDKDGSGPFTVSKGRNGRSAHIFYESESNRFVPYWDANTAGKAPNCAGALTVTTVARLDFAGRTGANTTAVPLWGLGMTTGSNSGFGLVCTGADSVGVVAWPTPGTAEVIVELSGIANLKSAFHFIAVVASPTGTTLYVGDTVAQTEKTIPSVIGQAGQLGSLHGGIISDYYRVAPGDGGYYIDDWAIYDAALTAKEIHRLRIALAPSPFIIRLR